MVPGIDVPYVVFEADVDNLATLLLRALDNAKHHSGAMIVGASGCGKSRGAYEVFRHICRRLSTLHVDYVTVNPPSDIDNPKDVGKADKYITQQLCNGLVANQVNGLAQVADDVSLKDIVGAVARRKLAKDDSNCAQTAVLVIHIDEFQNCDTGTIACLRAIRDCNLSQYYTINIDKTRTLVIPVISGLADRKVMATLARDGTVTDFMVHSVELHYFHKLEHSWALMYAAAIAALNSQRHSSIELWPVTDSIPTQKDLAATPALQILLRLVEDTSGWPMALVQLGARLGVRCMSGTMPWFTLSGLGEIEQQVEVMLKIRYKIESFKVVFGTSDGGMEKLLTLTLSPHSVSASSRCDKA